MGTKKKRKKHDSKKIANKNLADATHTLLTQLYCATTLALWEHKDWRKKRILDVFKDSEALWLELTPKLRTENAIPLKVLEDETGIELRLKDGKSWHEVKFLTGESVDVHPKQYKAAYIYQRQHQAEWTRAQIMASIFICLHRRHGWSAERLQRLTEWILEYEEMYKRPQEMQEKCFVITGINVDKEVHLY